MGFTKITPADLQGKGVVGLPDTPQLSALAMQQKFDEIATDVIVPKFNDLADELDNGAGAIMNVTDPTSGATDTLQNALDHIETENALNTADRHNHANKATLDDIDATVKAAYDRLVTLLGTITGIQSVLSSSTAELPDAKAVADAIATVQTEVSLNTAARHTHANKATLDDITALVKQGYDDLVTMLTGITGIETTLTNANNKIPRSDAVYTAVDNLSAIVAANTAARHTHANKATLDAIDATTKTAYDGLVTLFTGITSVSSSVTDDTVSIPNGHAIVDYVSSLGGGDMLKATYDTNDDGVVDAADYATTAGSATTADSATTAGYANSAGDSTRLGGLLSSAYALTGDLQKLFGDVATYQGTSVALRNYAVGDFMIYNNYFYEVTQAIAQGGTITENTNITQTTVGAVLARLALVMTGATSLLAGTKGLVPAPSAGDEGKFLKGDGTWDSVPNPSDMTGATSLTPGTHGLVPAPAAGDEDKVLRGDGTWGSAGDTATVKYDYATDKLFLWDGAQWAFWRFANLLHTYLFTDGYFYNGATGMTGYASAWSGNSQIKVAPSVSISVGSLVIVGGGNASNNAGTAFLNGAIDLTNYSKVRAKVTGYVGTYNRIVVANQKGDGYSLSVSSYISSVGDIEVDVSSLTGAKYIGFYINSTNHSVTVESIELVE